ncbi:MAG: 50S ribosomal protein L4 [Candidatus Liptonbacteria bacterium]|nr:50S ribosomal protein L4 [Candidatus Liptonbacteria bacterium]
MIQVDLYNADGSKSGKAELPEAMFGQKWNPDLVHQVLTALESNARHPWAHAKGRGEVRGGGKKPWRQKGTGRARHGSIRSPLWKGGGVTHGPLKERNYEKKINKKMRRAALFSVLSQKTKESELRIVRSFDVSEPKTKLVAGLLGALLGKGKANALIIPAKEGAPMFRRAARNLNGAESMAPDAINVRDLLRRKYVVIEQPALQQMEKAFVR